ncbi:hypothetical protein [Halomonas sp. H10-9-1]|uniref:hypothetical protein n=1 Tax=Halomonas sp. H10-9-1 TaxID=2950871 RepID=UPI0032DEA95A
MPWPGASACPSPKSADDKPKRSPAIYRLTPEERESLREEMRQAETRLAILAARSPAVQRSSGPAVQRSSGPAVQHLKVKLMAEPDEPGTEGAVCSGRDAAGAAHSLL